MANEGLPTTDGEAERVGPIVLGIFPPFLRLELVADKAFRDELGVEVQATLTLDPGAARFRQDTLFDAIRLALAGQSAAAVLDESGTSYSLELETQADDRTVVAATHGDTRFRLAGLGVLSPDPAQRLRELDLALVDAGLPPHGLPEWRRVLDERSLGNDEVSKFQADMLSTPQACMRALDRELSGPHGKLETIASAERVYYERLVGAGEARVASELAGSVAGPHIADLLAWDQEQGARMALLLASYAGIIAESPLSSLPPDALSRLGEWARNEADLLSKVGMIELGLVALPSARHLEPIIEALVREIVELNPNLPAGRLQFLAAAFVLVDGELSRTKALASWRPFRRRYAAIAQASLFERVSFGRLDVERFSKWAFGQRAHRFYLQTLVDMRLEPRWPPDYAGPDQLHRELISRIHHASNQFAANVPAGNLHELLFSDMSRLRGAIHFPGSFLPGPLEGSLERQGNPLPAHFEALLDESLAGEQLEPKNVTALINLRGLFQIDSEKVARAVSLIRDAGHRFAASLSVEDRDALIHGLASLAGTTRSEDLASDVRVMMRKDRVDGLEPPRPGRELLIALHAAAAHEEADAWREFVGEWARELAFSVVSRDEAQELFAELATLCVIEPALRKTVGRALAALAAYIDI